MTIIKKNTEIRLVIISPFKSLRDISFDGYTDSQINYHGISLDTLFVVTNLAFGLRYNQAPTNLAWIDTAMNPPRERLPFFVVIIRSFVLKRNTGGGSFRKKRGWRAHRLTGSEEDCEGQQD